MFIYNCLRRQRRKITHYDDEMKAVAASAGTKHMTEMSIFVHFQCVFMCISTVAAAKRVIMTVYHDHVSAAV